MNWTTKRGLVYQEAEVRVACEREALAGERRQLEEQFETLNRERGELEQQRQQARRTPSRVWPAIASRWTANVRNSKRNASKPIATPKPG